jgi:hypothetical protein
MQSLTSRLIAEGVDFTGYRISRGHAVSADGNTIAGFGFNPSGFEEAWIVDLGPEPIADAGDSIPLLVLGPVTLDGSSSLDPDGDSLIYEWTLSTPPGSTAILDDPTSDSPTFTADVYGDYVASLVVKNLACHPSEEDSVTVGFTNLAPMADAGPDQALVVGETAILDGTGSSDANMDSLTYRWNFVSLPSGSTATLVDPNTDTSSFVADELGDYTVQLIVNDGLIDSSPNTVLVTAISMADAAAQSLLDLIAAINGLPSDAFRNRNMQNSLTNKVLAALRMINVGNYRGALEKLSNDVIEKADGCAISGSPDSNDWIVSCAEQATIYPLVVAAIDLLRGLI